MSSSIQWIMCFIGITGCKNTFCFSFNDNKFENDELSNVKSNILKDVIGSVH